MNHLYIIVTSKLFSSTTLDITSIPAGMAVKVSDKTGIWDEQLLDFVPVPVKRVISKLDFLDLFTDSELEDILDKSKDGTGVGKKVAVFITRLELAESVDLTSDRTNTAVNGLETLGLISGGRATEILNV